MHPVVLQVLLEFPCELFSAVLAGRWAAGTAPFTPWMRGYWLRLAMAAAATTMVRLPWRVGPDLAALNFCVLLCHLTPQQCGRAKRPSTCATL